MKTIGFPISHKENEFRRAIIPTDIAKLTNPGKVYIESGFGKELGISDHEYEQVGCNICSREETLKQDIICDPKIGDADYLEILKDGQIIFGWVHATQNRDITDKLINSKVTAYAWENMFDKGRHVFWFNNELAGSAAIMHAFQCYGLMPYGLKVAILGNGNTARGALKILNMLGAEVMQYSRKQEKLFREELGIHDVIVNCILWDVSRTDHIVYKTDLARMKKGAMIIDVSCDRNGGIETSIPTTIEKPVYEVDCIVHYVVDHTPSLFYKSFSFKNSEVIYPYIEELMTGKIGSVLQDAMIIEQGRIIDQAIIDYQKR